MCARKWFETGAPLTREQIAELLSRSLREDDKTGFLGAPANAPQAAVQPPDDKTGFLGAPAVQAPAAPQPPAVTRDRRAQDRLTPDRRATPDSRRTTNFEPIPPMGEVPHQDASLASRVRPDLPSAADRHNNFVGAYHHAEAKSSSLKRKEGSSNIVLHGKIDNGVGYVAKPHDGIGHHHRFNPNENLRMSDEEYNLHRAEAPDNGRRHSATYSLMAAMGAHHMVTPGVTSKVHARTQFDAEDPAEGDDLKKRLEMPSHHAGGDAHVQEFVNDADHANLASAEELDKVDGEHRLHGAVMHLLMGNGDGHNGNVMIHKSGHPVLLDHDITLGSRMSNNYRGHYGKDTIKSTFIPGGKLDYQAKLPRDESGAIIPVGTNFPPRMKETLQRIAEGYYHNGEGALDLSDSDHAELKKNARQLLAYGLEGTLAHKHDLGATERAAAEQKRLKGEGNP